MLSRRIFRVLEQYDDEWVALSRDGVVMDHDRGLHELRQRQKAGGMAVTLLNVPPRAFSPARPASVVEPALAAA